MEQQRLQLLIDKCLSGRASAEEQQELDAWYAAQDANPGLDEKDTSEMGKEVFDIIHERIQRPRRTGKWMAAAAVLLVTVVTAFYFLSDKKIAPVAVWKEVQSGAEIKNLRLPDGSTVWLNAGTVLRYDSLFITREIYLKGEAFFDVAHVEGKTFEVHTGKLTTRVLGTAFNIDAYYDTISVFVKRGRVMVYQGQDSSGVLLPNQQLTYTPDGTWTRNDIGNTDNTGWTSGQLIFRDMPFSEVAKRLERRFGIQMTFTDPRIGQCSITASFHANTPLKDILEMVTLTNGSTIATGAQNTQYIISGKGNCK